jgi:hypothetical protein
MCCCDRHLECTVGERFNDGDVVLYARMHLAGLMAGRVAFFDYTQAHTRRMLRSTHGRVPPSAHTRERHTPTCSVAVSHSGESGLTEGIL